jgi:HEPN domain-containing protein
MDKSEIITYWISTSDQDFIAMKHLYDCRDYHWSLFIGHLVIEKLLKAMYIQKVDINPPKLHDLLRLAEKANIKLTEEKQDILDVITTFNINARYPDYKQAFYRLCDRTYAGLQIEKIEEMRNWLLMLLKEESGR